MTRNSWFMGPAVRAGTYNAGSRRGVGPPAGWTREQKEQRMAKIVFIGAGSFGFTRGLVRDILTFERLRDAELALVDIDTERLSFARRAVEKIVAMGDYPATVTATTDRRKALRGADAVLVTILCGGVDVWKHDILLPMKYGVDINIGDTRGPSGIFRALRTIPTMLAICRDMERLCPDALMLNYTNPMAMLCHAMQRASSITVSGLCHSVQGTAGMLARWAGVQPGEVDYVCAGINHMAFFVRFEHRGCDLYPKLRRVVRTNRKIYNHEQVRNEMFLALDYYVTESSGHNSEYNWWFRKRHGVEPRRARLHRQALRPPRADVEEGHPPVARRGPADEPRPRARVRRQHRQRLDGRQAVPVQRQRGEHRPRDEPAPRLLRRGARRRGAAQAPARPRRRPAAPVRDPARPQRADGDDGRRGQPDRRREARLPGRRARPADRVRPEPRRDPQDGRRDVPQEPPPPAAVQERRTVTGARAVGHPLVRGPARAPAMSLP
jgi:hypothetical protein